MGLTALKVMGDEKISREGLFVVKEIGLS